MTASAIDKLRAAADTGRLRATLAELLAEPPFDRFDEWADSLREIATAVDEARDAIETWADQEDRELKAECKDDALTAIESLVSLWDESPLDVDTLHDWTEPTEAAS